MEKKKSYVPVIGFNIYYIKVIQDLEIQSQGLYGINMYCKYIPLQPIIWTDT